MGVKQAVAAPRTSTEPGDTLLVLSPAFDPTTEHACADLLWPADTDRLRVLWVTTHESPHERIAHWEAHHDATPEAAAVIDVGATDDGPADDLPMLHDEVVSVTEMGTPRNLTRLGVEIVNHLQRWDRAGDDQVVLCFHSLSTFLQYVDVQDAFKFLHALTAELTRTGTIAHVHMDPAAHDERTINTLLPLFRRVVELDDGEWTHRSR